MKPDNSGYIDWDEGREGYVQPPPIAYAPVPKPGQAVKKAHGQRHLLSIRAEEFLGSVLAAAGTVWAVYVATVDYDSLWRMQIMPPGPMEICGVGILAWLHAKFRRAAQAR